MVAAALRCGQKQCDMPAPPYLWAKKCTGLGVLEGHFPDPESIRERKIGSTS